MTAVRFAFLWSLAVLAACLISMPDLGTAPSAIPQIDKIAHVLFFFGVGALWLRAYPHRGWTILVGGLVFGASIELLQGLLPVTRTPDLLDVVADVVGTVLGVATMRVLARAS